MICLAKMVYKDCIYVEGYKYIKNRKEQYVKEHYEIVVDECSNGRINQQKMWIDADNDELLVKIKNLTMYQQIQAIVNITFFEGKPCKIVCLDILDNTKTQAEVNNILQNYEKSKLDLQTQEED